MALLSPGLVQGRADTGHSPVPCKASAHRGLLQKALHAPRELGKG